MVYRLLIVLLFSALQLRAASWFVSTNGTGDGSLTTPWAIQTALTNTSVNAGDTIWFRGGLYPQPESGTNWLANRSGETNNPITLRSYSNEWAVIDGRWRFGTTKWLSFRDLEFFDSRKGFATNPAVSYMVLGHFDDSQDLSYFEWVNCVIHDVPNVWSGATAGRSIRGCIIWYTCTSSYDHVCYNTGDDFSGNIVGWSASNILNISPRPMTIRSNIFFGTGQPLDGINTPTSDCSLNESAQIEGNCLYNFYPNITNTVYSTGFNSSGQMLIAGNVAGVSTLASFADVAASNSVSGNTIVGNTTTALLKMVTITNGFSMDYNQYYPSGTTVIESPNGSGHTFANWRATNPTLDVHSSSTTGGKPADTVIVLPNQDASKRAHIAVFNWTRADTVSIDPSSILSVGDSYQIRGANNYNAGAVASGIYTGSPISVVMTNLTPQALTLGVQWGIHTPTTTGPEFGAFVLIGSQRQTTISGAVLNGARL